MTVLDLSFNADLSDNHSRIFNNLAKLKMKTGLTPNILARFAICVSIKDRSVPNPDELSGL